ncbi:MAG TPA: hypothetical protein VFK13_11260 [Gemmatimonadaceae bacterium]|nr:hypothetical protein [Gemmatimonadaceae bacterium]
MFDGLKQAIRDALAGVTSPAEGRAVVALMRDSLVHARMAVAEMRTAAEATRSQLAAERKELETARRRGALAAGIGDDETVQVAQRFAERHEERVRVLERKLEVQDAELALAGREVEEMTAQLKAASLGLPLDGALGTAPGAARRPAEEEPDDADAALRHVIDQAARDAAAERQLEELKRRMRR